MKILQAQIGGMDCGGCAKTIEVSLQQLPGVTEVSISFATGRLNLSFDPKLVNESAIRERITTLGYTADIVSPNWGKTLQAKVSGMDCGGCAKTIEVSLQQLNAVTEVSVNFASERLTVSYDPGATRKSGIKRDRV